MNKEARTEIINSIGNACVMLKFVTANMTFDEAVKEIMDMSDDHEITNTEAELYLKSIDFKGKSQKPKKERKVA